MSEWERVSIQGLYRWILSSSFSVSHRHFWYNILVGKTGSNYGKNNYKNTYSNVI